MKAGILLAVLAAVGAILWASGTFAPPARHLLITNATASPLGGGAAAILSIDNQGAPDRLVAVSSALAEVRFQNAARGLPIRTGESSLALDAAHIMVAGLKGPPENGTLLPLTLHFEAAGEVSVKARFAVPEPGSMAAHMAMGHGTLVHEVTDAPPPRLELRVVEEDAGWVARIDAQNFSFSEVMQDGAHVPGTGHGHIYVGDMKLGRVFGETFPVGALPRGRHVVRVTLNTNDHRAYTVEGRPVAAEDIIVVD